MLATREDHRQILVVAPPAHDIHHRLRVVVLHRQGFVEAQEQLFVAVLRVTADEQGRTGVFLDERDVFALVQGDDGGEVAAQPLPRQLQGQPSAGACLEMGMVRGGGAALRTVVEHHHLRIFLQQLVNLAVGLADALRLMPHAGDGEVYRQDGVGVHEQVEVVVDRFLRLFLRTVLFAEETRPLGDHLLIDAGARRHDARRVPLYEYRRGSHRQLARLHVAQVVVTPAGVVPFLQLTVEEALQGGVVHQLLFALEHLLTGEDLQRAQAILVKIVRIHAVDAQGSVAVASPPATEVELREDTSDAVVAREDES